MPEHTADPLSCWMRVEQDPKKMVVYSTHLYLVGYVENRKPRVMRNCINNHFWCEEDGIEEVEQLVDFLRFM